MFGQEILFGIIANMMSVKEIAKEMINDNDFITCTFNSIFSKDPGTLNEIAR